MVHTAVLLRKRMNALEQHRSDERVDYLLDEANKFICMDKCNWAVLFINDAEEHVVMMNFKKAS